MYQTLILRQNLLSRVMCSSGKAVDDDDETLKNYNSLCPSLLLNVYPYKLNLLKLYTTCNYLSLLEKYCFYAYTLMHLFIFITTLSNFKTIVC